MDDKPNKLQQSTAQAVDPGHGSPGHRHDEGATDDGHSHGGLFGANTEMAFALICGLLLAAGAAMGKWVAGAPAWLPLACYVAAYFFGRSGLGQYRGHRTV